MSLHFSRSGVSICDPMDCSTSGLPVHHQLLELAQTHVHRVRDVTEKSRSLQQIKAVRGWQRIWGVVRSYRRKDFFVQSQMHKIIDYVLMENFLQLLMNDSEFLQRSCLVIFACTVSFGNHSVWPWMIEESIVKAHVASSLTVQWFGIHLLI